MMMKNHFFHLVMYSPWPIMMSLNLISLGFGVIILMTKKDSMIILASVLMILTINFQWYRDIIRESLYEGNHSKKVKKGISTGMLFFIVSELCFFVSFFWMHFYLSLSPDISMGMVWPPKGVAPVSYLEIPLLNTLILLTSGFFITWMHYSMMTNMNSITNTTYMSAIVLGIYFFMIQMYEYYNLSFEMSDSSFGSSFFILTGFHGFHVLVGIAFIMVNLARMKKHNFSVTSSKGLEYSIWYWHFVDVIWLFLYISIYWWSM